MIPVSEESRGNGHGHTGWVSVTAALGPHPEAGSVSGQAGAANATCTRQRSDPLSLATACQEQVAGIEDRRT